jgi:hypothetical protein
VSDDGQELFTCVESGSMEPTVRYEFLVAQPLSPRARAAFPELSQGKVFGGDVLYGPVTSQEDLHALLARFRTMGLTVVEMRRLPD